MSTLLITPVGCHASTHRYVFDELRSQFRYNKALFYCSHNLQEEISRFMERNDVLIPVTKQFRGVDGYEEFVRDFVARIMDHIYYGINGEPVDLIIVNTSGGTEKMSLMFKDALDILRAMGDEVPTLKQVWGGAINERVIYTEKPILNTLEIAKEFLPKKKEKVKVVPKPSNEAPPVAEVEPPKKHKKKKKLRQEPELNAFIQDSVRENAKEAAEQRRKKLKEERRAKREALRQERHRLHMQGIFDESKIDL